MTNNMTESNNYNRLVDKKWFVCPLPKEDAFDVWSAFKCWSRNTGDAVTLQVKVLQRLRQVRGDVWQLVARQV